MNTIRVLFWVGLAASGLVLGRADTEYTTDGTPAAIEEEIRWHLNRGRFDSALENQRRGTAYSDIVSFSGPLAPHQSLTIAGRKHSEDMALSGVFQHDTVPGSSYYNSVTQSDPWDRFAAEGYQYTVAGENISAGYTTAESCYLAWWKSTGHRTGMYLDTLREIGTGYFYRGASQYRHYYTMDLGSRAGVRFVTDTLFNDANGDGTYDVGEGVAGLRVRLRIAGTVLPTFDTSSSVGSFAIPIESIGAGEVVDVLLQNPSMNVVNLSVPRDSETLVPMMMLAGETRTLGSFVQPSQGRNIGFRQLQPAPQPPPPPLLNIRRDGFDIELAWVPSPGVRYRVQTSLDCRGWLDLTGLLTPANASEMRYTDPGAAMQPRRLYRLVQTAF